MFMVCWFSMLLVTRFYGLLTYFLWVFTLILSKYLFIASIDNSQMRIDRENLNPQKTIKPWSSIWAFPICWGRKIRQNPITIVNFAKNLLKWIICLKKRISQSLRICDLSRDEICEYLLRIKIKPRKKFESPL